MPDAEFPKPPFQKANAMHYVTCPECKAQAEVSPNAVGPERTWLFNIACCDECGLTFHYRDEAVITDDRPPTLFF
jgi:hypothetical protein